MNVQHPTSNIQRPIKKQYKNGQYSNVIPAKAGSHSALCFLLDVELSDLNTFGYHEQY